MDLMEHIIVKFEKEEKILELIETLQYINNDGVDEMDMKKIIEISLNGKIITDTMNLNEKQVKVQKNELETLEEEQVIEEMRILVNQ